MAEKLVNNTGLSEFALKIKESVPLLGDSSTGTVPLIGTDMIADGAITSDKLSNDAVTTDKITNGAVTSDKIDSTAFAPTVAKTITFSMNLDKWAGTATVMKAPKDPWVTIVIKATSAYVSAGGYVQVASGLPQPYTGNVDWNGYSSVVNSLGDSAFISYDGKLYIGNTSTHSGAISSFMRITFLSDSATFNGV